MKKALVKEALVKEAPVKEALVKEALVKKAVHRGVKAAALQSSREGWACGRAGLCSADWERKGQRSAHAGLVGGSVCGSGCGEPARLGASAPTSFLLPALPLALEKTGQLHSLCSLRLSQAPAVMSGLAGIYGLERERDHHPRTPLRSV